MFIDELEDLVSGAREEELAELVAGLLGIINGDFGPVSGKCSGDNCRPGGLHIVASLTPPAYSRLMGLRDFAAVAAVNIVPGDTGYKLHEYYAFIAKDYCGLPWHPF